MSHVEEVRRLARRELPLPGSGNTAERLRWLFDVAANAPLSVARLVEAHHDACAILAESGRTPDPDALYGVWASQSPSAQVELSPNDTLTGAMRFASGLGIVDRALITTSTAEGTGLVDVALDWTAPTISIDLSTWNSPALTSAATGSITFDEHPVDSDRAVIGPPGWYLSRVGFWHGACAPAACWAGGASAISSAAAALVDDDPHRRAHTGALLAHDWSLRAMIDSAGNQIDERPTDARHAQRVARSLRFSVADIAHDVLRRFSLAYGPRAVTADAELAQRCIDVDMYIRQHHGERELGAVTDLEECM